VKSNVIIQGLIALGINIKDTWPIKYVLPGRFFRQRETDQEHKTIVHEVMVLRKMTRKGMLKIIIIKIIAIHLLLNY